MSCTHDDGWPDAAGRSDAARPAAGLNTAATADSRDPVSAGGAVVSRARLTVLSGPSGVGKGTVVAEVRRLFPHVWVSISCTTRKPRAGEADGVQYHFLTEAQFEQLISDDQLLEFASFAGHRYGTPRRPVEQHLAAGRPTVLEIELQGARQLRDKMPDAQFVLLAPPSLQELRERLVGRQTESEAQVQARLRRAEVEMAAAAEFDAVVVNDDVERAAAELVSLIELVTPVPS